MAIRHGNYNSSTIFNSSVIITDVNGQNLVGANVYLFGTYDGASTNGKGRFQLFSNEVGSHILCVDYIGFEAGDKKNQSPLTTLERNLNSSDLRYNYKLINDNYFANTSWMGELKKDWMWNNQQAVKADRSGSSRAKQIKVYGKGRGEDQKYCGRGY